MKRALVLPSSVRLYFIYLVAVMIASPLEPSEHPAHHPSSNSLMPSIVPLSVRLCTYVCVCVGNTNKPR